MTSPRRTLASRQIRPKRSLSQSFLQDPAIAERMADMAKISAGDTVVEIGAGLGILTTVLARKAGRVFALEIDARLIPVLQETLAGKGHVCIVQADALAWDFRQAAGERRAVQVFGNLPYAISTALLFRLSEARNHISRVTVMLQKEVAERLLAPPGTRIYGIPSVLVQAHARAAGAFDVPPTAFYPRPEVTSTVVCLDWNAPPPCPIADEAFFPRLVRLAFAARRKTLQNNLARGLALAPGALSSGLAQAGIDGRRRAETLSVAEFIRLSNDLGPLCRSGKPFPVAGRL